MAEMEQKREECGVTQTRLAVACGISHTYFNQIENGRGSIVILAYESYNQGR